MNTFLFDFDGTLVDSMPTYIDAMFHILEESHIPYNNELVKVITPLGVEGTADYYINTLGVNKTKAEIINSMQNYMLNAYCNTVLAKDNVISVLQELKNRGACLNVLTASPHLTLDPCLKRLGIYNLFDNVWSCDDFHTTKANPEIYKAVAAQLNTDIHSILFLDDNFNADKTAKSAGMQVCGVYDEFSKDYVDEIKAITDYYIYNFSELLSLNFD